MPTFIAAADETADHSTPRRFYYVGIGASAEDWHASFSPAWDERVLAGPPRIPYLHMVDILSVRWRAEHGVPELDVDGRLEEASRVLRSTGALVPVAFGVDVDDFNELVKRPVLGGRGQRVKLGPDYILFTYYAYQQIQLLVERHGSAVERVDFQIDRNSQIAAMLGDEDRSVSLRDGLQHIDHPDLAALVGSVTEVGKASIPNQAADTLAWHTRRAERGDLDRWGSRRYWRMIEGGSGSRFGMKHMLSRDLLRSLGERFSVHGLPADGSNGDRSDSPRAVSGTDLSEWGASAPRDEARERPDRHRDHHMPSTIAGGDIIIEVHRIQSTADLDWSVRVEGGGTLRHGTQDGEGALRLATAEAARLSVDCWFFPLDDKPFELVVQARGRHEQPCSRCGAALDYLMPGALMGTTAMSDGPEVWRCPADHEHWSWHRIERRWGQPV